MPESKQDVPQDFGHIRALDGIRGAAVLVVFCYHGLANALVSTSPAVALLRSVAEAGWAGVDVFFVLSGFLITTILLDARHAKNYYSVFYARRALRITPLYYAVLIASLVLEPGHYPRRAQLWYWLNLSNLPTAFVPFLIGYLAHFWSLAIEEQFYLVWPSLVRRLRVRTLAYLCVAVVVGVFLARNLPQTLAENARYPEFVYRLTPFRIDTLCGGALVAILVKYRPQWVANRVWLRIVLLAAFGLFAASGGYYRETAVIRFGYTALLVGACALLLLSLYPTSLASRAFSNRFLRKLGKYSYSFYLFHPYVVNYGAEHAGRVQSRLATWTHRSVSANAATALMLPVELALVFVASAVSWRLFEGPILKAKRYFRYDPRPEHYLA